MKILPLFAVSLFFLLSGTAQPTSVRRESYSWAAIEQIPRDSLGRVNGTPHWDAPWQISPAETPHSITYLIYGNYDSIRTIASDGLPGNFFKKVTIHAAKWKPKPQYNHTYFFVGTYEEANMDGAYFSIYATKDWSSTLEIMYTNPGNMMNASVSLRKPVNGLQREGFIIEPEDELAEPDQLEIKMESVTVPKIRDQN